MKIFILEGKQGEVLGIFTHKDSITYTEFNEMCADAGRESDNDFYIIKDKLINELEFALVEVGGGFIANKRKGLF